MGLAGDREPDEDPAEDEAEDPADDEEQSALELAWAIRTTPLTPQGPHPSGRREPDLEDVSPADRKLEEEMHARRRQLVELLAAHLSSGARTVPAILSRLSA